MPPDDPQSSSSHPWVYSATSANGKITFRVEVTDLQKTEGPIEITGVATQVDGAYAPIFGVTDVPGAPNGDQADAAEQGRYFVDVDATPTSQHPFTPTEDLTVFTRASKVWVTVLGPGSDDGAATARGATGDPVPTWGKHKAEAHVTVQATPSSSHPWVYSATAANGKITFRVEVTDFQTTVGAVEITGVATQVDGAFAPIFGVIDVPRAPNGDQADAAEQGRYFVDVDATPTPQHPFRPSEDLTVFARASKVWVTVLGPGSDDAAAGVKGATSDPVPTWGKHRADSHMIAPDGAAPVGSTISPA